MNVAALLLLALVAAEPTIGIASSNVGFDYDAQEVHNDSVLRLLRSYRFTQIRPWTTQAGPDSSAIRSNNLKMKAALLAFQRRRGSFFRMPASYYLADTTSLRQCFGHHYIIISRGRCRMVEDYINVVFHSVNTFDVDSIRLSQHPLKGGPSHVVPCWASRLEYVPLELDVFIREGKWHSVIIQHHAIYL